MRKTKYILKGFLAVVMAVMFVQCADQHRQQHLLQLPVQQT